MKQFKMSHVINPPDDPQLVETLQFFLFSHLSDAEYRGGVRFRITYPDGKVVAPVVLVTDDGVTVSGDGTGIPDSAVTCTAELTRETFFQVYWNKLSSARALMTGVIKIEGFAIREISRFVGSFDTSTANWDRFYAAQGIERVIDDVEPGLDLLPGVWNALSSLGSLLVSPLTAVVAHASKKEKKSSSKLFPSLYSLPDDMFTIHVPMHTNVMPLTSRQSLKARVTYLQQKNRLVSVYTTLPGLLWQQGDYKSVMQPSISHNLVSRSMLKSCNNTNNDGKMTRRINIRHMISHTLSRWQQRATNGTPDALETAYLNLFSASKAYTRTWIGSRFQNHWDVTSGEDLLNLVSFY